ncbi:leucokinins isoform X2 [Anopheles stephensi]|uniref:leucokinins isoform X2 n=1 Tax=Anopheles stephensi TaxID=30069 RepID=UPI001658A5F2|nr:leucokinins isoform X2 [Anopheles stephensi]
MAIFCLVLATAAFVLTSVPQACRCDRSDQTDGNDLALRAILSSSDNGLEGKIWQTIRERFANGDENNNLISADAKLTANVPASSSDAVQFLESLINRYRKYVVERFVRFDDACSVELLGGGTSESDDTEDNEPRTEISHSSATSDGLLEGSPAKGASGASNQLGHDLCSRGVKQYYRCLMERFNDRQLIGMLQDHLETYCFRRGDRFDGSSAALRKRDTPRYVSKQKFHSWGGKRNTAQVFYPWGGKRTVPRPHKQPKVVIRNPFHSWGGKRSGLAIDSVSD